MFQYIATAVSFYYGNLMGLHAHVSIILIFAVLGLISYHYLLRIIEPTNQKNDKSAPSPPIPTPALRDEATKCWFWIVLCLAFSEIHVHNQVLRKIHLQWDTKPSTLLVKAFSGYQKQVGNLVQVTQYFILHM